MIVNTLAVKWQAHTIPHDHSHPVNGLMCTQGNRIIVKGGAIQLTHCQYYDIGPCSLTLSDAKDVHFLDKRCAQLAAAARETYLVGCRENGGGFSLLLSQAACGSFFGPFGRNNSCSSSNSSIAVARGKLAIVHVLIPPLNPTPRLHGAELIYDAILQYICESVGIELHIWWCVTQEGDFTSCWGGSLFHTACI